ncbi:LysR family transcriptional regulator [Shimazuella alba]|uniref:LysR family transcriptional regulator n=1 Tax=Shimazuella alba TaxID=2690964 RepID=A0A6I4VYD5_9BACL|nr:LysR family transcriptional regulator [Shimazuella alba]MXQ55761.1 LysR family transcriptional regulator [Shimazuella alba]
MELLQLHYFRTVAQLEHMTKAAEELHIAQPALSQSISRLEKDLGVPLFDRKGRQIKLNSYGKIFLQKAETALKVLEEGQRELSDRAGMEYTSIYIVASAIDRLSGALKKFLSMHPKINFRITQASMDNMAQLIEDPEVDFCFTAVPIVRPGVFTIPVLKEEIFLGVPPGHRFANRSKISLSEAANEPFINYRKGYPFRIMNDTLCYEAGFSPNVVCEADDPGSIASLVRAGLGVAFVGSCKIDDDLTKLRINEPACHRIYELVWLKDRYLSLAARNFRDFLVAYFLELQTGVKK